MPIEMTIETLKRPTNALTRNGPLGVIVGAFLVGLLWLSLARGVWVAMYWERLVHIDHNVELERDALAHLLWADRTYRERLYRLPAPAKNSLAASPTN